jgi:hypothetical protein
MLHVTAPGLEQWSASLEREAMDLLLSDESLVQEIFEDIVTAEWPPAPDAPAGNPPGVAGGPGWVERPRPFAGRTLGSGPQCRAQRPGISGWARERSPPGEAHLVSTVK